MFSQTHTQFIESINKITKKVIESTDSFNNYYIEQDNSFYSDTLPYLIKPNSERNSFHNTENRLIQLKKNNRALNILRHEHFRSKKIPKLCPIFNNRGDLIPSIAINSKISKRDFNLTISSISNRSLASFPFKKNNILSYNTINYNNTQFDYFNNYKNDFFKSSDYINLKYNEEEIFNQREKYDKLIKEKVEFFKKNKNENLTTFLEKNFIFGPKKKKIHLKLTSLMIYFEDPSEVKEPYYNNSINKNLQIEFPFSLLPLFYYRGIETFKKLLCSVIKFENNYEKVRIDDDLIYEAIINLRNYSLEAKDNEINKKLSLKEPIKQKNSITIEHDIENDIENIQNELGTQFNNLKKYKTLMKSYSIHPHNVNLNENQKYNSYSFLWITPKKNFKVTIILPLISYTVPSNSIKVQQFIDFELLFYLYNINFLFWDFYIMKYLFGFKQFRFLLERLTSHLPIFNIKLFLNEPKKSQYTLNEEKYKFIYTNENDNSQIISLKCFNMRVTILDYQNSQSNEYNIYFNFKQLVKIIQIGKFASKIFFLIKFMDINNDNTLHFNYQELEQFEVISWLNDIEKYNGGYFLQKVQNPIDKLIREFNASPTKKVKLELNIPIIKIITFTKINEKSNIYSITEKITDEFPNKNSFLEWSILIKDSLNQIKEENLLNPIDKETRKKMSIIQNTIELEERTSISKKKGDIYIMKSVTEDEKKKKKRAFSTIDRSDNENIYNMIKGKKNNQVNNIDIPLPVMKKIKSIETSK